MTEPPDHDHDLDVDYLCWYAVWHLDRWAWPDETTAECIASFDPETVDEATIEYERGYHTGMFTNAEGFAEVLNRYVDVYDRAEAYRQREDLTEFETLTADDFEDTRAGSVLNWPDRDLLDVAERARELREADADDLTALDELDE